LVLGCVTPIGEQGAVLPKIAAQKAGWDVDVPGMQINRFCASGLETVNLAAQKVASGWEDLVIAGGVESMSRVPMGSDGGAMMFDPMTNFQTNFVPQGIGADLIATLEGFSRRRSGSFCTCNRSSGRRRRGANGRFTRSLIPVIDMNGLMILAEDAYHPPRHDTRRS
jgi:acetyl-CoA C-acetyltransferase